ncbi:helix-turn-helix transcriptional regulator [Nocardioides panzhihuensis]|uniref:Transcriptional regulator with XRE-family HTH domain n=1 Tax=Nocardioides panzhihuensis TaxID=860243 RepID=A0A7Z0DR55_9ACTN|nr:helix-turn-helix transcriptional regulator [Nocardioides panzhihuensis]NYI79854.1 transcriptional regulator with XRE-family HTH domain [Nocardioides panzhihuensis]
MAAAPTPLGEFLRAQRARISPGDVGLPDVGVRRVPGLRREEVAVLAGVSADYYARLEQGRERAPTASVVETLSVALLLSADARDHLFRLARLSPGSQGIGGQVSAELNVLLDAFPQAAAYVVDPVFRIIAANPTARELLGPQQLERGAMRFLFVEPGARKYFDDWEQVARAGVSALRLGVGYARPHPDLLPLIDQLRASSPDFATLWADQTVAGLAVTHKVINHPEVGRIALTYQTFDVRDAPGQQLTVATAVPGTSSADALSMLGSLHATRATTAPRPSAT